MKTLIFNGSPRKNGNTSAIVERLASMLGGETKVVRAYECGVRPCIDCRYCWKNPGCAIKDAMQEIYADIQEADNIVIASPTYFSELSGQLLAVLSRLQTFWCSKYLRGENPVPKEKRGGVIVVRGGVGMITKGIETAKVLLSDMNARLVATVFADNSDSVPSLSRPEVEQAVRKMAEALGGNVSS